VGGAGLEEQDFELALGLDPAGLEFGGAAGLEGELATIVEEEIFAVGIEDVGVPVAGVSEAVVAIGMEGEEDGDGKARIGLHGSDPGALGGKRQRPLVHPDELVVGETLRGEVERRQEKEESERDERKATQGSDLVCGGTGPMGGETLSSLGWTQTIRTQI
jgi:hypothetical protein